MNIKAIQQAVFISLLTMASGLVYGADFVAPATSAPHNQPLTQLSKQSLSETVYRQFQAIQKQIDAKQYDHAFNALTQLAQRYHQNPHVVSVAMRSAAYIYITQQQYAKAISWMQQTINLSALPAGELQAIRHDLSQLQSQEAQYQEAINTMQQWLKGAQPSQIASTDYQLIAASQFHLKQYSQAKKSAQQGLKISRQPNESLYQIILSCDLALNDYESASSVLSTLVTLAPSHKSYWMQWVSVLEQQGKTDKALVILELMDKRQMLSNEQERIHFVQRLMQQNNAFKAANKLDEYMKSKQVLTSTENQQLLASAWALSGESSAAMTVLTQQMSTQPDSDTLTQLVRLYVVEEQWQPLIELLEAHLKPPITEKNEPLYFQLGYGYYQLGATNKAKDTFRLLTQSKQSTKKMRESARQWLTYIH